MAPRPPVPRVPPRRRRPVVVEEVTYRGPKRETVVKYIPGKHTLNLDVKKEKIAVTGRGGKKSAKMAGEPEARPLTPEEREAALRAERNSAFYRNYSNSIEARLKEISNLENAIGKRRGKYNESIKGKKFFERMKLRRKRLFIYFGALKAWIKYNAQVAFGMVEVKKVGDKEQTFRQFMHERGFYDKRTFDEQLLAGKEEAERLSRALRFVSEQEQKAGEALDYIEESCGGNPKLLGKAFDKFCKDPQNTAQELLATKATTDKTKRMDMLAKFIKELK